ncbi:MAG: hypothetical protein ACO1QB_18565 [Verrucomicrobiales bacterium]
MASKFDESEFVDSDFEPAQRPAYKLPAAGTQPPALRPPSREELEIKVTDAQARLAELKRVQEDLEREKASLEDARRRRLEFTKGHAEMLQHLTRGTAMLAEAEFAARRDAEQMSKSLAGLRDSLEKVEKLKEDSWTQENWQIELTRALTTLENARMEWNTARLKWTILDGVQPSSKLTAPSAASNIDLLQNKNFWELCKLGFALTWPLAAATLLAAIVIITILLRQ